MERILGLFLLFTAVLANYVSYDGYILYEISVKDIDQGKRINDLGSELHLDVWSHPLPGRPGLILVPGEAKEMIQDVFRSLKVEYKVASENIEEDLKMERNKMALTRMKAFNATRSAREGLDFDRIYSYAEVKAYLEEIAATYPETVTLVNAGRSIEGRDINYLRISTTNFEDTSKPVVFVESLLHSREWISQPATLYAIEKLVVDVTEQDLLQDIDWIILPILNPDGFVFSMEGSADALIDRFWRKNRRVNSGLCMGVDLNRNFDFYWGTASSAITCMEDFHGTGPLSEPESQIVSNIVLENLDRMELFLDIHSFGSMILYGYGTGTLPPNALQLHVAGIQMAGAIDDVKMSYNPNYIVGNVALVLYTVSGGASDYVQSIGVPFSYTYELPQYRFGFGSILGFLVDEDFIEQAGMETWEGIKTGARYARGSFRARRGLE